MLNVAIELFDKLVKESESKLTDDFSEVKGKKNTVLTNNKIK